MKKLCALLLIVISFACRVQDLHFEDLTPSLTYDMVVKGHGGSIQVNSVEGEGAEFIIQLPV